MTKKNVGSGRGLSRGQLLDHAVLCAIRERYRYRGYETAEKTLRALARRCPGIPRARREQALNQARQLYALACEMVTEHRSQPTAFDDLQHEFVRSLKAKHPWFLLRTINDALGWAWYWCVLK